MKKTIILFLFGCMLQTAFGQDTLVTNDKKKLEVRILEKNERQVKYTLNSFADGPVFGMKTADIRKIEYRNGTVDNMGYDNPRKNRAFGVSAGMALDLDVEGGMFTTTVDYFLLPQIDMELNLGSDFQNGYTYSFGSRFHLNSNRSHSAITPFVGLLVGSNSGLSFVQIPIGLSYISKFGLQASVSINQRQYSYSNWLATSAEFRIGWRFKK